MSGVLRSLLFVVGAVLLQSQIPPSGATSAEYVEYDLLRYRDRAEADGSLVRTQEVRALLRTAAAVDQLGQITWPYVDGYGDVQFEDITIGKPDGHTVLVTNGLIEDLNPFGVSATALSADLRLKKLTIPGLEPGDWLSYKVVCHEKPLAPGHLFGEMKLEAVVGEPIQTYELDLPRNRGIRVHLREDLGAKWEDVPAPSDRLVRRLSLKVERPRPDRQVPTKAMLEATAEPDVVFTNFASWAEVGAWWWALSGDRLVPDASVQAQEERLLPSTTAPREMIQALHRFVASRIRYVEVGFGIGRMQPRPAGDVLATKYGDRKDKHALLAALASAAGIEVSPVLIDSTHPNLHDDVPSPQQFDHMISVARLGPEPEAWLWLDTTNPFGPPGYLPPNLRDKRALLIEPSGEGRIVRTPAVLPFVSRTEIEVRGTLALDAALRGREIWRFRSDVEVVLRSMFAMMPRDRQVEAIRNALGTEWKDCQITNVVVSDPTDTAEPFRIEFEAQTPPPSSRMHYLKIPLPRLLSLPTAAEPIEGALSECVVRAEIDIPEGMSARAPRSLSLDRPFGSFGSTYSVEGRRLTLARTLKLARGPIPEKETASHQAFRKAVETDRDHEFALLEFSSASDHRASPRPRRTETRSVLLPKDAAGEDVEYDFQVDEGFIDAELTDIPEGVSLCMCIGISGRCYPFCGHDVVLSGALGVSGSDEHFKPGGYEVSIYYYPAKAPRATDVNATLKITYPPLAGPPASSTPSSAASAGTWNPPERADPTKILREAHEDGEAGRYELALKKYLWFHHNALKFRSSLIGVRLSFALDAWFKLGGAYPPAMAALKGARDEALSNFNREHTEGAFRDFKAINKTLGEEGRTAEAFVLLDKEDPQMAERIFAGARSALVRAKEYTVCGKYLKPKEDLSLSLDLYRMNKALATEERPEARKFAESSFTNETTTLIALLVVNGREGEAKDIASAAKSEWDDPVFHAAVDKALQGVVPEPWP